MPLVPEFMHSLKRYHEVEWPADERRPARCPEVHLQEAGSGGIALQPKPTLREHRRRKVEQRVQSDRWTALQDLLGEKARARAELQHPHVDLLTSAHKRGELL